VFSDCFHHTLLVFVVSYVAFHVLAQTFVAVIMARRPFEAIKDIHDGKSLWRIAVLVKDLWVVRHGKSNKQHMELVVRDKLVKSCYSNTFFMSPAVCCYLLFIHFPFYLISYILYE
jgi:hypothetical protein